MILYRILDISHLFGFVMGHFTLTWDRLERSLVKEVYLKGQERIVILVPT